MRVLGNPLGQDARIVSGESGAVGMGVLAAILHSPGVRRCWLSWGWMPPPACWWSVPKAIPTVNTIGKWCGKGTRRWVNHPNLQQESLMKRLLKGGTLIDHQGRYDEDLLIERGGSRGAGVISPPRRRWK